MDLILCTVSQETSAERTDPQYPKEDPHLAPQNQKTPMKTDEMMKFCT